METRFHTLRTSSEHVADIAGPEGCLSSCPHSSISQTVLEVHVEGLCESPVQLPMGSPSIRVSYGHQTLLQARGPSYGDSVYVPAHRGLSQVC